MISIDNNRLSTPRKDEWIIIEKLPPTKALPEGVMSYGGKTLYYTNRWKCENRRTAIKDVREYRKANE